jgi:GTPase SAR1 family protein
LKFLAEQLESKKDQTPNYSVMIVGTKCDLVTESEQHHKMISLEKQILRIRSITIDSFFATSTKNGMCSVRNFAEMVF